MQYPRLGDINAFGADPRRVVTAGHDVDNAEPIDFGTKYKNQNDAFTARFDSVGAKFNGKTLDDYVNGQSFCCNGKNLDEIEKNNTQSAENAKLEDNLYFYHPDHLGSTSMVTNYDGEVTQNVAYIPYGEVFVEERNGSWNTPFLFNAKELDEETGLYYYGARYLDPTDCRWLAVDQMWEKYVGMTPYGYCAGNPVKMVDPDGRKVKPKGVDELEMITNTLTEEDAKYVKLDKNGLIDKNLINSHKSESGNYNDLVDLVNSDKIVDVIMDDKYYFISKDGEKGITKMSYFSFDENYPDDKDVDFKDVEGLTTGEMGFMGKTLFPDRNGYENSTDADIKVIVNKNLTKLGAAETFSHEAYGHVSLYIKYNFNHKKASHIFSKNKDGYQCDANKELSKKLLIVVEKQLKILIAKKDNGPYFSFNSWNNHL